MTSESQEHVDDLLAGLKIQVLQGQSPDIAREKLANAQQTLFGKYPEALKERLAALETAYSRIQEDLNRVQYLQRHALGLGREQWYLGPASSDSLWSRLSRKLESAGRTLEEISLVDQDSSTVLGLLDRPSKDKFATRGLVIGHVQSGKTGNMAAVINKAAETPYKFFLILSGMTDQLRNQTQTRLDEDVVALDRDRWMQWTAQNTPDTNGDFAWPATGGFSFDHRNQLAVLKKNGGILRRFLAKLKNTNHATLRDTAFLVIDDECDQASVNSARYTTAVTKINELIRTILAALPRSAYVGYTATPFANVLIDTTIPEDLYPRHFIHALQRPPAYFGAEELFGRHALEGEYDEMSDGYDMIRTIPDPDASALRPAVRTAPISLPESLKRAIRYFMMVTAARRHRGAVAANNTMLIHTSVLNSIHRKTERLVAPYVDQLRSALASSEPTLLSTMKQEWTDEHDRILSEQFDRAQVPFSAVANELSTVATATKVRVENWTATDRLTYEGGPHTYIVIGGNVLARGLTLDGLSVSYFLRSSSQYDTLMQMGRWFGYRAGFEDLPRVWVENRVRDAFFDLATVEAEIRRDVARYAEEKLTPEQFAVRIRKIPGMTITAPAKMRSAVPVTIGYSGTHVQTFRFKRKDGTWLDANWAAGSNLLSSIPGVTKNERLFRNVAVKHIVDFLRAYKAHETHKDLSSTFLNAYIEKGALTDPRMQSWSVVVVDGDGAPAKRELGPLGHVRTVVRSAEVNSADDASIKALMSRGDILRDLNGEGTGASSESWDSLKARREAVRANALLILYPIEAMSNPRQKVGAEATKTREALAAVADVLGYGIAFPGDKALSGTYVSANIAPEQTEPTDNLGAEDMIPDAVLGSSEDSQAS